MKFYSVIRSVFSRHYHPGENRGLTTGNQSLSAIRSVYWRINKNSSFEEFHYNILFLMMFSAFRPDTTYTAEEHSLLLTAGRQAIVSSNPHRLGRILCVTSNLARWLRHFLNHFKNYRKG